MDIVEKLRLIARGFELEKVTDSQAKSSVSSLIEAANEIETLRTAADQLKDTVTTKVNANQECVITLLERGVEAYKKYYTDMDLLPPEELKKGDTFKGPLWQIMNIFGPSFYMGPNPPIEMHFDLLPLR